MHHRATVLVLLVLAFVLPLVYAETAHAIPAFSRQYKTECSTCHTIYPELNEYGQAFQKNGYVYTIKPKAEAKTTPAKGEAGQVQAASSEKNEGLLLAGIPELLPVSFTATQSIAYNEHGPGGDNWNFDTRSLMLQAGGSFRELAGFYLTYNLFSHAENSTQDESGKIDELFVMWRRLFTSPINLKFGKFEPKLSLWKKNDNILPTPLATSAFTVGDFSLQTPQDALEANAVLADRIFVAAGIVDVKGQNDKNGYGHVSVKFGGADMLGNEPEIDLEKESLWDYLTLSLALYGYVGRNAQPAGSTFRNDFYRVGGDMDLLYKRVRLRFSGVTGRDTNPQYTEPGTVQHPLLLAAEAQYLFGSPINVIGLFRYEHVDSGTGTVNRYIPAVAYIPLQNVKLVLEYIHEDGPEADASSITGFNNTVLLDVSYSF